ncbi:N-methyl-L-tryptophan oxidase [Ureibacillus aquaedulcis]|uniref:N-methyl-L-tryptophan oxidase n=1 Tax=Ureibacillus aquaedulcis TaxID=3058421 RepID=A0ABT8GN41_9BACL|nr:N-methyl-L-tryptophan oxidase [Ureibacillus sp. BA0131]MDN4492830.1 N-methyl-L-tryptophan oxidase [Ureibacillus sp. BA0131]
MVNYDVIVVGAGSMGMAAGYYLSLTGKKVLLLDSHNPPHDKGSHHGETRIIRHAYGEGEEYVPLALKAQELWHELEKETGSRFFLNTGVLNVGKETSSSIKNIISSSKRFSIPIEIMSADEIEDRWPGITVPSDFIGCYEPTSGVLRCEECIEAYRELAKLNGATILTNSRVTSITAKAGSVEVSTDSDSFTAHSLILTAGAWSNQLLSMLDLELPLNPVRKTFAWFDVDEEIYGENFFPAFAFDTPNGLYYGFPSIQKAGLKVGRHDGGATINPDKAMTRFGEELGDQEDLTQFLTSFMPTTENLMYGKTCTYTLTPDEDFIVDLHPKYPNIAIAAGFSGHGFKFSSVIGKILSELIINRRTNENIDHFAIERFK